MNYDEKLLALMNLYNDGVIARDISLTNMLRLVDGDLEEHGDALLAGDEVLAGDAKYRRPLRFDDVPDEYTIRPRAVFGDVFGVNVELFTDKEIAGGGALHGALVIFDDTKGEFDTCRGVVMVRRPKTINKMFFKRDQDAADVARALNRFADITK